MAHRLPACSAGPTDDTPAVARHGAVHCVQSGLADSSLRIDRSLAEPLSAAIQTATGSISGLNSIELLVLSTETYPSVVVHATQYDDHNTGWMTHSVSGPQASVGSETLAAALADALPDWYGIEQGTLLLDPLGVVSAPTSRLVAHHSNPSAANLQSLVRTVFRKATRRSTPTVCQLLCRPTSSEEYRVTVRVAEYGRNRPLGRCGLTNALDRSTRCLLDELTPKGFSSTRRLAGQHWVGRRPLADSDGLGGLYLRLKRSSGSRRGRYRRVPEKAEATALRGLDSVHEYTALLQGNEAADPYASHGVSPTLTLSDNELVELLDVTPLYHSCGWSSTASRRPPLFGRQTVQRTAAGTDHEVVLRSPTDGPIARTQPTPSLVAFTEWWLTEAGCRPMTVSDRSAHDPHFCGHPNDSGGPVVVVDPDLDGGSTSGSSDSTTTAQRRPISTAGGLVVAANTAFAADRRLLVVTPSREAALWARDVLATPYVTDVADRTGWYELPTTREVIRTESGGFPVVDRDSSLSWLSTPDGRRCLVTDTRRLSAGPSTEPPGTYTYDTYRVTENSDGVDIRRPDGSVHEQRASLSAAAADYRAIYRPVTSLAPLYCGSVTIVHRDGSTLTEPLQWNEWTDSTALLPREAQLGGALETFVEQYTYPVADSEQCASSFLRRFLSWYDSQSVASPINGRLLTRLLRRQYSVRVDGNHNPVGLYGRAWWPPNVDQTIETTAWRGPNDC